MSRETKLFSFYKQCEEQGYTNMQDETQSLKAKVIAMDLNLRYKDIADLFEEAKCLFDRQKKIEEEQQRKKEEEEARLAVKGELVMTLEDDPDKEISIYRRPDSSRYYTLDNGKTKIEGVPEFEVTNSGVLDYKYHEGKVVYTGATVGGVTTGGTHVVGPSVSERVIHTGKGKVMVNVRGEQIHIKRVKLPADVVERFRRDPVFSKHYKNGYLRLVAEDRVDPNEANRILMTSGGDYRIYTAMASRAMDRTCYEKSVCYELVQLLGRIRRGDYPPSDADVYEKALVFSEAADSASVKQAMTILEGIPGYEPADKLLEKLKIRYEELLQQEKEAEVLRREQQKAKLKKIMPLVIGISAAVIVVGVFLYLLFTTIIPNSKYNSAKALLESGKYEEAVIAFEALDGYKDSDEKILESKYGAATALLENKEYQAAHDAFAALGKYNDAAKMANESLYQYALGYWNEKKYEQSNPIFESLGSYSDSRDKIHTHDYASKVLLAPTCVAEGSTQYNCNTCSHTYTAATPATGHDYSKSKVIKAATCEADGVRTISCHCGATGTEVIKATGHSYSSKVTTKATCEKAGVKTLTCKCGKSYTESVSATGHSYVKATCTKAKHCKTCNKTEGAALGHNWSGFMSCTRCKVDANDAIPVTVVGGLPLTGTYTGDISLSVRHKAVATITEVNYNFERFPGDDMYLEVTLSGFITELLDASGESYAVKRGDMRVPMKLIDNNGNVYKNLSSPVSIDFDENGTIKPDWYNDYHESWLVPKNALSFQLVIG